MLKKTVQRPMSVVGTFATCRRTLKMSVYREVKQTSSGRLPKSESDPMADIGQDFILQERSRFLSLSKHSSEPLDQVIDLPFSAFWAS
jgi:hypothetical protein